MVEHQLVLTIVASCGDTVSSYDIGPHTGSPLEGVHDTPLIVVSHISLVSKSLMGEGEPKHM